jgi:acetyl-CoA C-acetyltransferase
MPQTEEAAMAEAFIYDAVRTPRGKGKSSGSLHEITSLQLATQALKAIKERNNLDTSKVDDVILGCVTPIGEQGSDIARIAVLNADYSETTAGLQVDRFCASGLEACNIAAAKVMTGEADMAIGGGIEAMSRVPMGSNGGAWASNPEIAMKSYFAPQGIGADLIATKYGFSRDDVDAYAVESQKRAARAWKEGRFSKSVIGVKDQLGVTILAHDETVRGDTTMQTLAALNPSFEQMGQMAFDDVVKQRYPEVEKINHVHHAGNSSGIVDGASAVLIGNKVTGDAAGLKPRARIKGFRLDRLRAFDHADGPGAGDREAAEEARHGREGHRSLRAQRSLRLGRAAHDAGAGYSAREDERERRRHRDGPPAGRHGRHDPRHRARRA